MSATPFFRQLYRPISTVVFAGLLAACASGPSAPQIEPAGSTVKLGRIASKTFLTQVSEAAPQSGGVGMGVGAFGGFGGSSGGGVGLGIDLGRIFGGASPTRQIDIYTFRVRTLDGQDVTVNAPAQAGLEIKDCVRVIYASHPGYPRIAPSRECP